MESRGNGFNWSTESYNKEKPVHIDDDLLLLEAFALPDKSADSVARGIYAAYCRHGAPNDIITDQGREFVNKVTIGN